jgi:hypothetical protein
MPNSHLDLDIDRSFSRWRTRSLEESAAARLDDELAAHARSFSIVKKMVDEGDLASAARSLGEVEERVGKTASKLAKTGGIPLERKATVTPRAQRLLDDLIGEASASRRESVLQPLLALRLELFGE